MKHTQRFRIPDDWKCHTYNHVYFGLVELTIKLSQLLEFEDNKMIEIGHTWVNLHTYLVLVVYLQK